MADPSLIGISQSQKPLQLRDKIDLSKDRAKKRTESKSKNRPNLERPKIPVENKRNVEAIGGLG